MTTLGLSLLLLAGGCEVISLATLSTVFGVAGTVVSTGPAVFKQGKLDTAVMAGYEDSKNAVWLAARDLHLQVKYNFPPSAPQDEWQFDLLDDLNSKIIVTIEKRSLSLCRIRIDVGLFGSEPTARLIMERIETHLPGAASRPDEILNPKPE